MRDSIISLIIDLANRFEVEEQSILDLEERAEDFLRQNPHDIDVWLRYAIFEFQSPISDYTKSLSILRLALDHNPKHVDLTILYAYIMNGHWYWNKDLKVLDALDALYTQPITDSKVKDIIPYLKAMYYDDLDETLCEKFLAESTVNSELVNNYVWYGTHLIRKGDYDQGKKMIRSALSNIVEVYDVHNTVFDFSDYTEFLRNRIYGTHLGDYRVKELEAFLEL